MVFTSPMSAEAYFTRYKKDKQQTIVSIGKTTTTTINELGINEVFTAFDPSQWSIIDVIFSVK